jgi:hypothetical protein
MPASAFLYFFGEEFGTRISHEAEYAPFGMAGKPVSAALFKLTSRIKK